MRNYIASTIVATGLVILVLGMHAHGQAVSSVVADIPFDFFVGTEKLPSGRYEFARANKQVSAGAVIVRSVSKNGNDAVVVPAITGPTFGRSPDQVIVFNRYGSAHFLAQVKMESTSALSLLRSGDERRIAKQIARSTRVLIEPTATEGN